jgi:hypothetical protein
LTLKSLASASGDHAREVGARVFDEHRLDLVIGNTPGAEARERRVVDMPVGIVDRLDLLKFMLSHHVEEDWMIMGQYHSAGVTTVTELG